MDWRRFMPKYWFQNEPSCEFWDKALNQLLDGVESGEVKMEMGYATVTIDGIEIWNRNYPYSYGSREDYGSKVLPYVKTRKRLFRLVRFQSAFGKSKASPAHSLKEG